MTTRPSWVTLVSGVLDDEQRTRRGDALLSHVTVWLIVLGAVAVAVAEQMLGAPWWVPTGAGGISIVSAGLAALRRRRKLGSADEDTAGPTPG